MSITNFLKWLEKCNISEELPIHLSTTKNISVSSINKKILLNIIKKDKNFFNSFKKIPKQQQEEILSYLEIKHKSFQKISKNNDYICLLTYLTKEKVFENKIIYDPYKNKELYIKRN